MRSSFITPNNANIDLLSKFPFLRANTKRSAHVSLIPTPETCKYTYIQHMHTAQSLYILLLIASWRNDHGCFEKKKLLKYPALSGSAAPNLIKGRSHGVDFRFVLTVHSVYGIEVLGSNR